MRHVKTKSLHKGVSTAQHHFVHVPGQENKLDHLSQVLHPKIGQGKKSRSLYFVIYRMYHACSLRQAFA